MAEYVDVALLKSQDFQDYSDMDVQYAIDHCPRADVVPREEHEELIYKLSCLLCCASGGKLSKHTYDLKTMETVVNDYINESYYDGAKDTAKEIFHEIFEIIKKYEFDALAAKENYGVFQVRNFGCDIMKLREKYVSTEYLR